ncbi:hypothetical protein NL676_014243 [Syzygium grande]|nr:hypothetical protein NL676_014243 [Syzygium grande]
MKRNTNCVYFLTISHLIPLHPASSKPPSPLPQTLNPPPPFFVLRTKNPFSKWLLLLSLPVCALLLLLIAATNGTVNTLHCRALEGFDPVSPKEQGSSAAKSRRIAKALGLLEKE